MIPTLLLACLDELATPAGETEAIADGSTCQPVPPGEDPELDDLRQRAEALVAREVGACGGLIDPLGITDLATQLPELWVLVRQADEPSPEAVEYGTCPCAPEGASEWVFDCATTADWHFVGS